MILKESLGFSLTSLRKTYLVVQSEKPSIRTYREGGHKRSTPSLYMGAAILDYTIKPCG